MSSQNKWILGLAISTVSLAILCGVLSTWLYLRPLDIKEVIPPDQNKVIFDLGGGRRFEAPGDGVLVFEGDLDRLADPQTLVRKDGAKATGVGYRSWGGDGKLAIELDFGLPETDIEGGPRSIAGYANLGVKAVFGGGATTLYIIGGLAIIVGAVLIFWLKAIKMGIGFIAGGLSIIMLGMFFTRYPWVLWLVFIAAILVVIFLVWDYWRKRNVERANEAIIAAGEGLPHKVRRMFTKLVGAEADVRGVGEITKKVVQGQKKKNATPRSHVDIEQEKKEIAQELSGSGYVSPQVVVVPQQGVDVNPPT